jgi:integrase
MNTMTGRASCAAISGAAQREGCFPVMPAKCVSHGLRKAAMRRLAEDGSTEKQIAAVSGHKTLREIERYTAAADQRRLAKDAFGNKKRTGLPNRSGRSA